MSQIDISLASDMLDLGHEFCVWRTIDAYGCVPNADIYFSERLNTAAWEAATDITKEKALKQSTRILDHLNYVGEKTSSDQPHAFPRDNSTEVPKPIEIACYEIAYQLVAGFDPDKAADNLRVQSERFADVGRNYFRSMPDHITHGIPSVEAWRLLLPYLRNSQTIKLERVS